MPDENEQKVNEITDSVKGPAEPNINPALYETLAKVIEKIDDAESILVTLSKNPNVDEISAALGLTLLLDQMGKHVTAIYSGETPNAVQFLDPDKTFEKNTDSLQDFIISLEKEKADHLRYKLDGDFVRVYITPYKTKITKDDLEFSEGEVAVDLIICLNVSAVEDLDAALSEHGRIVHDAGIINISNSIPGHTGGLEWNDGNSSSISEMIVKLMDKKGQEMTKDIATALLTGIVAETERFSNEKTMPSTMTIASELMRAGADQQLVAAHVMPAVEKPAAPEPEPSAPAIEPGSIEVKDDVPTPEPAPIPTPEPAPIPTPEPAPMPTPEPIPTPIPIPTPEPTPIPTPEPIAPAPINEPEPNTPAPINEPEPNTKAEANGLTPEQQLEQMISAPTTPTTTLMNELKNAVPTTEPEPVAQPAVPTPAPEPVAQPIVPTPEPVAQPIVPTPAPEPVAQPIVPAPEPIIPAPAAEPQPNIEPPVLSTDPSAEQQLVAAVPTAPVPVDQVYEPSSEMTDLQDGVIAPVNIEQPKDYGAMMEEALAEDIPGVPNPAVTAAPIVSGQLEAQPVTTPIVSAPAEQSVSDMVNQMVATATPPINLPPPPIPPTDPTLAPSLPPVQPPVAAPQDPSQVSGIPEAPAGVTAPKEPVNPVVVQPGPDPASVPPVPDPGAFKIPGM